MASTTKSTDGGTSIPPETKPVLWLRTTGLNYEQFYHDDDNTTCETGKTKCVALIIETE